MGEQKCRYVNWTGKNGKQVVDMLEKIGDRITLVYGECRSKSGVSRSIGVQGRKDGKIVELVSWTSHIAVVEFKGVV